MTTEEKRITLERTEDLLFRTLADICDDVDNGESRVADPVLIDGVKDIVKSLKNLKVLGAVGVSGSPDPKPAPVC